MVKKNQMDKLVLEKGKVIYLKLVQDGKTYEANVSPKEIAFREVTPFRRGDYRGETTESGVYNRKTKNYRLPLSHVCGAQGFGMNVNDGCMACMSKTGYTSSTKVKNDEHFLSSIESLIENLEHKFSENILLKK